MGKKLPVSGAESEGRIVSLVQMRNEFLAALLERSDAAEALRFLDKHIMIWVPAFAQAVESLLAGSADTLNRLIAQTTVLPEALLDVAARLRAALVHAGGPESAATRSALS